jgi:hypothetical protein
MKMHGANNIKKSQDSTLPFTGTFKGIRGD